MQGVLKRPIQFMQKNHFISFKLALIIITMLSISFSEEIIVSQDQKVQSNNLPLTLTTQTANNQKTQLYLKEVMDRNRKIINEHNLRSNKSYKMKENRFIIFTQQEFNQKFLNLNIPTGSYVKNKHLKDQNITVQSLQNRLTNFDQKRLLQSVTIDWKFLGKVTSVKYQKQCGSCYAFSALAAIQSAYILFKKQYVNVAEQQIVDCSAPYGNLGCLGGWTSNTFNYVKDFGVVYENDYPYYAQTRECKVDQTIKKFGINNFVQIQNDCNLVIQALKRQPLSIAINANGWQYYGSGIYTDCQLGQSNHGVLLAGVSSTSWLIKNSWGYSWGQDGYIRVSRTAPNNACNVCQWASYPVL